MNNVDLNVAKTGQTTNNTSVEVQQENENQKIEVGSELTKNAQNGPLEGEISFMRECTDGVDDGNLTLKEKGKALLEGGKNFFKSMVCDEDGNFSLKQTAKTVVTIGAVAGATAAVVAAGIVSAPVAAAVLVAGGVAIGVSQIAKGAIDAADAKTDVEAKEAYANIGEGATLTAISLLPAKAAFKGAKGKGGTVAPKSTVRTKVEKQPNGFERIRTFDKKTGDLVSVEETFEGRKVKSTYEKGSRRSVVITERSGAKREILYDENGNVTSRAEYNNDGSLISQTKYEEISEGVTKITNTDGSYTIRNTINRTTIEYDANGKQISKTVRMGGYNEKTITTYENGNVVEISIEKPIKTVTHKDAKGTIVQKEVYNTTNDAKISDAVRNNDGTSFVREYEDGRLLKVKNYDTSGKQISESNYSYNQDGKLIERVEKYSNKAQKQFKYDYDPLGNIIGEHEIH